MHTSKLDCQDILSDAVKVQLRARLDPSKLALPSAYGPTKSL